MQAELHPAQGIVWLFLNSQAQQVAIERCLPVSDFGIDELPEVVYAKVGDGELIAQT